MATVRSLTSLSPDSSAQQLHKPDTFEGLILEAIESKSLTVASDYLLPKIQNRRENNTKQTKPPIFTLAILPKTTHNPDEILKNIFYFLQKKKTLIKLTECDADSNTFLHYAIWQQQYSIAENILDIATETKQHFNVLSAQNQDGYTPYDLLMGESYSVVTSFFHKMAHVEQFIAQHVLDNKQQCSAAKKSKENDERTDTQVTLEILKEIITKNEQELRAQKNTGDANTAAINAIERNLNTLYFALSACQRLVDWLKLAYKMDKMLIKSCISHDNRLYNIYSIQFEEYNPYRLLQTYPCYDFGQVKRMYLAFKAEHPQQSNYINELLQYLNKIEGKANEGIKMYEIYENPAYTIRCEKLEQSFINDRANLATISFLKGFSRCVINRHAMRPNQLYLNVITKLERAPAQELESFKETIECLKECEDSKSHIADAFSQFMNVLTHDQQTSPDTKKIIYSHFDDIGKQFITEKLTQLGGIATMENDLQVKLMGLPPMSPRAKAAIGVLLGLLAGATICFTGGLAAAPVLATAGSLGGAAGFFYGRKKAAERQNGYDLKVEHLRTAMNTLSGR